jgi:squalene-associated FAD-dependent desaturase
VRLARAGRLVRVYEAAGQAGGRCRSFHDAALDRLIDNGNHMVLSGNRAALAYLDEIGAADSLAGPPRAEFPFLDLESGLAWTLRPGAGSIPWWIISSRRRVPDSRAGDYLRGLRLAFAGAGATVADCLDAGRPLYRRFWEPLAVAVLNALADEGAATLLWPVLRETFGRGEAACRPRIAAAGLSRSFVDPALSLLGVLGCPVRFNARVRAMTLAGDRVTGLDIGGEAIAVEASDAVVLAVPPAAAGGLIPGLETPRESRAIVNGHFRLEREWPGVSIVGLVGGVSQWLFRRADIASVTVSAAAALIDKSADVIAARLWPEVARALELGDAPLPPYRIVKEKRATFAQVPAEVARRPGTRTAWHNLFLAGDWTGTGLPATIEGAVRSGHAAAAVLSTGANT